GCCVAGPADVIAQVRDWRQRMGGTLFAMWPNAASALSGLAARLPRMPQYLEHAQAIASALRDVPGVRVIPDPPQTPIMHWLLSATREGFDRAVRKIAAERGIWTWAQPMVTADPGVQRVELSVGDATCALSAGEIAGIARTFAAS